MTHPSVPREWNRTLRVLDYLESQPDGATLSQITAAIEPGASSALVGGTLGNLLNRRVVRKTGKRMFYRYHLVGGAKRCASRQASTPPPARAQAMRPPAPKPKAVRVASQRAETRAKFQSDGPKVRTQSASAPARIPTVVPDRERIAADVAAFLAAGGHIEHVPIGQATRSDLRFQHDTSDLARARAAITNRFL